MSILTDPHLCPECRSGLDRTATCTGCGLRLVGPAASRLWETMQTAATLVEELRRTEVPSRAAEELLAAGVPGARPSGRPSGPAGGPPPEGPAPRRSALPGGSVPVVLFGVGALCLLVAAIVFVAVAWSSLGLGARTTILLGVTAGFAGVAAAVTKRGLRGAAETFWVIVGALVTIDLTAAHGSGLLAFDTVPDRHAAAVIGATLVVLGLGTGAWVRRTAGFPLVAGTVLTTVGTLTIGAGEAWTVASPAVPTTASVLGFAALAAVAARLGLRPTAYAVGAVTVLAWSVLVEGGLARAADATTASWWQGLDGWPLLAAAALAASVALVTRVPETVRTVAAAATEVVLALLVVGPGAAPTTELVVLVGIGSALAVTAVVGTRVWALPAVCLTAAGLAVSAGFAVVRPLAALDGLPRTAPARSLNLDLRLPHQHSDLAPWTALLVVVVALGAALALIHWIGDPSRRRTALVTWSVCAPTLAAVGVATLVLESGPTLIVAVIVWAAALAVLAILATTVRGALAPVVLAGAAYLGTVGLTLAVGSHLLAAVLATAVAAGLAVAYHRTPADEITRALTAAAGVVSIGFAATHWPYLAHGTGNAAGIALVLVAAVAGLLAVRVARGALDRVAIEVTALAAAFAALGFPTDHWAITTVLTLAGTAVALVAVLNQDRDDVAWLGTVILLVAAVVRAQSELAVPELTTAPAAALLLVAGVRRMRVDPEVSSLRALGSGLVLMLSPTLVLALDEPLSLRSVVIGLLALAALATGVRCRWSAPFLAGAGTVTVLAVRHLGPIAEGLPRWISLGAVGAVLLVVAVTWEARRRELATAERYLTALR